MSLLGEEWGIEEPENEQDWPDLVVNGDGGAFGLEIRKVYSDEGLRGSPKRGAESQRARALKDAADAYYAEGAPSIRVQFYGHPPDPSRLAEQLAGLAPSLKIWENTRVPLDDERWMYVCRLPTACGSYHRWASISDSVGWVGTTGEDTVQGIIYKKAENLPRYRTHLNDIRLLLVADRTSNSGRQRFSGHQRVDTAGFDYVYLMSFPEAIIRIPAQQGAASDAQSATRPGRG